MRKQLHRVKQLADQTFNKAEKTEPLTDDMQAADKHVEQIRAALTGLNKRLANSKNSESNSQDKEKRIKKCPEYILGQTMLENAGEEGPMSYTLTECGKAQMALANEIVDHESKVEQYVTIPLQQILDSDIPSISKHKKSLHRSILDMDSVKGRYHQASKHNFGGATGTKVDSLREELEEAEAKVESNRDLLASDMFQLMSKEIQLAQTILQYIKLQRAYHESALHSLEDFIPDLESFLNDNEMKPVYNYSLEEHLRITNRKIALPIQLCVCALMRIGLEEEGLFRVAGSASKLKRLKLSFDACCLSLRSALEYRDPHVIAGALKSYLRELPDPLLTSKLYYEWVSAAKQTNMETRLQALHVVIHKLPTANYENLRFLIRFFNEITKRQDINKMSPHNLAIVIAPNLLWNFADDKTSIAMDTANYSSLIVEDMITYATYFFPGEIDFDQDFESMIMELNDTETNSNSVGMRRCVSNNSLNDLGESPIQGSPKPVTRRKNKLAPTPPSGTTPDKQNLQQQQQSHQQSQQVPHYEYKRPDEKPPPAPDKPPRPLVTSTLNRAPYKSLKLDQVTAELIQLQATNNQGLTPSHFHSQPQSQVHTPAHSQSQSQIPSYMQNSSNMLTQVQDNISSSKTVGSNKLVFNNSTEDDMKPIGFDAGKIDSIKETQIVVNTSPQHQTESTSSISQDNNHKSDSDEDRTSVSLININVNIKASELNDDVKPLNNSMTESIEILDSPKMKSIPSEKPALTTLERRKPPVATPRYLTNANTTIINQQEDHVEMRKKPEGNNILVDKNSKPAIPERPAGLPRPSSLIRGFARHSIENLDTESGVSMLQVHSANEMNGASSTINLQRSPSVGSRPSSMSVSASSVGLQQQLNATDRLEKPPRPEPPPSEHVKAHSRTRSEGNIIDVQTQTQTVIVPRSSQQHQQQSTSPRFYQRPPRPQPPPPPPPVAARLKSDNESTNL